MTDTGQVPGQGLPENAGMVEQPGVPAPGAYTYLDHSGGAPEAVTEDDDLLLMPGAQGAWSDPAAAPPTAPEPAPAAAHGTGHVQPVPVAQDTVAALHPQVPGAQAAPGYAGAGTAAVPEQTHAHTAQEQQYTVHEQRLRTAEQQTTPAQGVPQQAAGAQAAAGPVTAEQPVAGQVVTAGAATVHGQPAVQEQPPAPAQPAAHDRQSVHGQAVPHGQPAQDPQTAAEQPLHEAGAHEAGGRDSGSLDLGGVRMPPPAASAQTPPQARRPLHMGPPVPEANSGVVRSLADRGPAAHRAGGASSQQGAVTAPVAGPPAGGPEYLDVPRDEADLLPGPQLGVIPPQGASPWAARHAQPGAAVTVPAETASEAVAPVSAETVPPRAVPTSAAEPAAPEPYPAGVPAEVAPESMATGQFPAVEGSLPTGPRPATSPVAVIVPAEEGQRGAEVPVPSPEPPSPAADSATTPPEAVVVSEPEPESVEAPQPVAASGSVPAPGAGAAEPVAAPEHVAAAGTGAAPEPESVAVVPAPREGEDEDETAAADRAARTGRSAEVLDATQPAGTPVPAPEGRSTGEPGGVGPVPAAERTPGAETAADAERPGVPEDAGSAAAGSVPALAGETAPEAESPAETRAEVGPESPAEPEPGREPGTQPVADGVRGAGEDVEAEAEEIQGAAAPGYADAEREAVLRVMRERRDIRNGFRSDPVPHDVLLRVLEAAHTAPSVGHSQPWDFVVIRSAETRRSMHELAQRQREAYAKSLPKGRAKQFKELKIEAILDTPVNIVVTADPTRGGRHTLGRHTQPQMAPYSSALAVENLWLAARAEGLGVGWVSFFDEREMVRALGLPEHLEVVAYLCVGYVDEFPEEPELMQAGWSKRRPLSWVVHEETYGRRALPGEEPHDLLQETVSNIRPLDAKALGEAWERQKRMTKPAGALGMLEIISAQLAGLSRMCPPPIPEPAAVAIFAGDHGVHAQGVTAWPQEVTGQMVANFLGGGAVCNAFANQVGAEVCVIDVGVASDLPATPGLLPRKVRPGTADFTTGPALGREEVLAAIEVGIETARDLVSAGNKALLTGEMGIANTTASAALISVYTGVDPAEVTGRGTGINDEMHARKVDVVRRALELHQPDVADPVGVLAAVGGLEHAALVGFILGGASLRTPVVLDGVSAGAAALVARAVAPEALAACIAGHRSAEPGHVAALNKLGLRPLVDLDLRLGEGTGALLALPLVQSAARAMHEVATFDSAGVTEK
ncbi:nicotinate-nucleotide--dimethylbenzimidazole phosphoribosyltransferase [Streptomyces sp. WMMC940]|uniref:nicotinate-nucleotide--dimethylbenzimidazole phosphoribosyltransferase n=1 Tax=Streptomyces sp. WMMC940 TaxID=3015153 RepID=UPI0022B62181|nr:nicotinate-nucleotide--dimethylbenzimidazole phosphoribosyltransferase [Streptomyces sp. WMMC940]MCZ7461400.1 nicotinate-nucleotide--dimethylbenzimidazole phosphoribosyltransferase [Streptomyces sp. WMMC940]